MMDANNIQVNIFHIYSSRKASECMLYRNSILCNTIYSEEKGSTEKKRNYKFVEQNSYLCLKALYKYV